LDVNISLYLTFLLIFFIAKRYDNNHSNADCPLELFTREFFSPELIRFFAEILSRLLVIPHYSDHFLLFS